MGGLIVIDSLGFTVELSNVLRDRTAAALHTGRERIMVCFSLYSQCAQCSGGTGLL